MRSTVVVSPDEDILESVDPFYVGSQLEPFHAAIAAKRSVAIEERLAPYLYQANPSLQI
jgi:hypothetical protein